jgi:hypothetical protein
MWWITKKQKRAIEFGVLKNNVVLLNERIDYLEGEIDKLKMPFEFNVGDRVKYNGNKCLVIRRERDYNKEPVYIVMQDKNKIHYNVSGWRLTKKKKDGSKHR